MQSNSISLQPFLLPHSPLILSLSLFLSFLSLLQLFLPIPSLSKSNQTPPYYKYPTFFLHPSSLSLQMDKGRNKKRSGQLRRQIPAFGNWDSLNDDMPITQYFESARQAGLTRFSSSSSDFSSAGNNSSGDLYAAVATTKGKKNGRGEEKRCPPQMKEAARGGRQAVKVYDYPNSQNGVVGYQHPPRGNRRAPKAVDEDLYKIPPELLRRTNRKKRFGFISSCLVLPCTA